MDSSRRRDLRSLVTASVLTRAGPYCVIFILALALRLIFVSDMVSMPLQANPLGDAEAYLTWGSKIASGEIYGDEVYYQAPLYPHFIGLIEALGGSRQEIRYTQITLGSLATVLLALAGSSFFGRRTGLLAGLLLALYPSAIFFDGIIQKSALDGFLISALLYLVARIQRFRRLRSCFLLGLTLGLLALNRENALIFAPILGLWFLRSQESWHSRMKEIVLFGSGLALFLFPVALRNHDLGGSFQLTTSQAGPNFFIGNNREATGLYQPLKKSRGHPFFERKDATDLAEAALGRTLDPEEVSDYWFQRSWDDIQAQPGHWIGLLARKMMLVLSRIEIGDFESQDSYGHWSPTLHVLNQLLNFGTLIGIAVLGAFIGFKHHSRSAQVLLALAIAYFASVVAFYVFGRYRYPLVHFLILFSSLALTTPWRKALRRTQLRSSLLLAGTVLLFLVVAWWPSVDSKRFEVATRFNCGVVEDKLGRTEKALALFKETIELAPNHCDAYCEIAKILDTCGKPEEARTWAKRAIEIDSRSAVAWLNFGLIEFALGRRNDSRRALKKALEFDSQLAQAHYNLGIIDLQDGKVEQASRLFEKSHELEPRSVQPLHALTVVSFKQSDYSLAAQRAKAALDLDANHLDSWFYLALSQKKLGAMKEALEAARMGRMQALKLQSPQAVAKFNDFLDSH